MAREPKYGMTLNGWQRLLTSMEANAQDLQSLEIYRTQLQTMLDAAREAAKEQTAMAAAKQDATQRLQDLLMEGRKLATFLRGGVRQRYGDHSEKLVEFDLSPSRAKAKPSETAKPPATPPPSTPTTA